MICERDARRESYEEKVFIPILIAVVLVSIGARTWWSRGKDSLAASGTLEARNISVGSKVGGRILSTCSRGRPCSNGPGPCHLRGLRAERALVAGARRYAQAKAVYAKLLNGSRPEDIAEAKATGKASESEIFAARATVNRAESDW